MSNAELTEIARISAGHSIFTLYQNGQISFVYDGHAAWQSAGPFCMLHYYDRQHPRADMIAAPSDNSRAFGTAGTTSLSARGEIAVRQQSGDAMTVLARFPNISIEIAFQVCMRADGQGFTIEIDDAEIVEEIPSLYRILDVEVLPQFGAAVSGETGYLTLPNWFGCQTFFNRDYPREVRQTIYSSNDQWEHVCNMPVFGITREQGTLCGLVAAGDYDAQLITRVHWEREHSNSTHPCLVYRWQQQDERILGRREVRYTFAPANYADGEGYVFLGKTYRQFLREERGLLTWTEKEATRPEATDYLDRFFLKIFMAYKEAAEDGHGRYHATCTFAEAKHILEQCLARGMKKLTAILVGWGQDGHDGMSPTRFPIDERLGGETAFRELIAWCQEHDIQLGVHDGYGAAYSCSPEFDTAELIRHRTGEHWASIVWSGGRCHITCPAVYLDKYVKRDISALDALGLHGHHHIDAVGSFMPCYSPEHPVEQRADFIDYVRRMFQYITGVIGGVSTEYPFGCYFDVVDGFFHSYVRPSAWHLASPVGRYLYDRTVPLLAVALHGSNKCCEAMRDTPDYLAMVVDLGLSPESEVCQRASKEFGIKTYESVADQLAETYRVCYGAENEIARLGRLAIDGRWEIAPGVARTRYEDGTEVTVNRTDEPCMGLPPHGYSVQAPFATVAGE